MNTTVPMPTKPWVIINQVAAKMTSYGFPNQTLHETARDDEGEFTTIGVKAALHKTLTDSIEVWEITDLVPTGPVYALVVNKGHSPLSAHHVVDFRVGGDIYS